MTIFVTKRIYESSDPDDGYRTLVDRLWPRGVSKARANLDEWAKDLAPSSELREWFGHIPERFNEFAERYKKELQQNPQAAAIIANWNKQEKVTLLFAAKNTTQNEAIVLKEYLSQS